MKLPAVLKSVSPISKTILVCAVSLCFAAAAPATFAQRGGGGSHGGGHAAGGSRGSGGSSVSTGSSGRASGATSRSYSSRGVVSAHGTSARGFSRNTFVPGPGSRAGNSANPSFLGANSATPVGARPFAASNFLWEDPPQQGRRMTPMQASRPMAGPLAQPLFVPQTARPAFPAQAVHFPATRQPSALALRPVSPLRSEAIASFHPAPRHPVVGLPFSGMAAESFRPAPFGPRPCIGRINPCGFGFGFGSPFFNPFFFSGFGFGFGGPCFFGGVFSPCGFGPFGLGLYDLDYGYDFGNGDFYSPAEEPPPPPWNADEDNPPVEFPTYSVEYPFLPAPLPPPVPYSAQVGTAAQPVVKLVLKDGTIFGVTAYWLADGRLNYITTYNIQTSIPIDDLDLQKTVDLNYKLGITFTLTPKPPDSQQPPPQNQ
ncbi:MAG: hypothetical protein WAN33_10425 [Candidatus Acidiferrales bacterium]